MAKSGRGVLYVVWGGQIEAALQRSLASLKATHPELPTEIIRLKGAENDARNLLEKSRVFELSPFEETLYLDADTIVLGPLDFAFDKAARFGLACCINECPWARRYNKSVRGDLIEYNTGVLFFSEKSAPLFARWQQLAGQLDSSVAVVSEGKYVRTMPFNDQCAFAAAVDETGYQPFVLPLNWNFRPYWQRSFFGPIRIWHAYEDPPKIYFDLAQYYRADAAAIQYVELE